MPATINAAAVEWALRQRIPMAPDKLILLSLASRCEADGIQYLCSPLFTILAHESSTRRGCIGKRINRLVEHGFLERLNAHTVVRVPYQGPTRIRGGA